jgi:hypothetical protein
LKDLERNKPANDSIRFVAAPASRADGVDDPHPSRLAWRRAQMPWLARLSWMWLLIGCVLLLAAGIHIKPDPRGHGTHEQLGFAPCGFYLMTGYPCPTCGATTAFAWMVHGRPWMAVKTQPFGALTAVAAVALLGMSIVGIVTAGVPAIRLSRRSSIGLALLFLAVFLGSWLYKVIVMTAG